MICLKTKVKITMEFEVDMLDMLVRDEIVKLRKKLDSYTDNLDMNIDLGT